MFTILKRSRRFPTKLPIVPGRSFSKETRPIEPGATGGAIAHHDSPRISTVDPEEIQKFQAMADSWWHPDGPFQMLHLMNPVRVEFIRRGWARGDVGDEATMATNSPRYLPLQGLRVLDVGCGGGILSESLARLGAQVTGIDASEKNVRVAEMHARSLRLRQGSVRYVNQTAESLLEEMQSDTRTNADDPRFDLVCAMEILEHVSSPPEFLRLCHDLLKPGGIFFASTINRNWLSYGMGIVLAENILRLVPPGTHDPEKFITPEELQQYMSKAGFPGSIEMAGMHYHPLLRQWFLVPNGRPLALQVNYLASARKDE